MLNLKEHNITIVELQELTGLSRPTLYKYIDFYNEKEFQSIRLDCLKLFEYIENSKKKDKSDILLYYKTNCYMTQNKIDFLARNIIDNCSKDEIIQVIDVLSSYIK